MIRDQGAVVVLPLERLGAQFRLARHLAVR